jgi:hydroxyacylglutathione hydrolase
VVAPRREAARIPDSDVTVREGDVVSVGQLGARVLDTPGHTAGHIAYWFKAEKIAFVGDTLFSIGCGRVLEGTPEMMWQSLLKLRNLPGETQIYCGHEYTAANVAFARTIDPNNRALDARAEEVAALRAQDKPTIPATIAAEKAANPFLRVDVPTFAASLGLAGNSPAAVFAKVRAAKDSFKG